MGTNSNVCKFYRGKADRGVSLLFWIGLKQELAVVQSPEWKFKANIAKNSIFEESQGQIFTRFVSKMAKNLLFSRTLL